MRLRNIIILILLVFLLYNFFQIEKKEQKHNPIQKENREEKNFDQKIVAGFDRVVDGDTLVVFIDGQKERVRMIGVNAPESTTEHRNIECFGKNSSRYLKEILSEEKNIFLEFDPVSGKYDKHGRILAHVFLADGTNLNQKMIADGFAYEYTYRGQDYLYKSDYKNSEDVAQEGFLGLWAEC